MNFFVVGFNLGIELLGERGGSDLPLPNGIARGNDCQLIQVYRGHLAFDHLGDFEEIGVALGGIL